MLKQRFVLVMVFCLIGVGIALTVHAQQEQPITPPTVDAAVATLIAETQAASSQIGATQTIQVALEQALTATAQALITPTLVPETFDVTGLTVSGITNVDLYAGPVGTSAYLAPDGERFAYLNTADHTLCTYKGSEQQSCVDLSQLGSIDSETPRWSPDSRYLAFTEDFFRTFHDPDIWVFDTTNGTVSNITDDGNTKLDPSSGEWKNIDIVPRWTDDGKIVFLRYSRSSDLPQPPEVHEIGPDGSGDMMLGTLPDPDPFAIYAMDVWHDTLVYAYASQSGSTSDGVWISDLDGTNPRQLTHQPRGTPISGVDMSPDGKTILITTEDLSYSTTLTPQGSRLSLVDAATGSPSLIDPDHFVSAAGWSPQGSALLYVARDPLNPIDDPIFLTNTPGEAGQRLDGLAGDFNTPTPRLQQTLVWGANNTILISHSPAKGIALIQLSS